MTFWEGGQGQMATALMKNYEKLSQTLSPNPLYQFAFKWWHGHLACAGVGQTLRLSILPFERNSVLQGADLGLKESGRIFRKGFPRPFPRLTPRPSFV
jgi:hypothetical protein